MKADLAERPGAREEHSAVIRGAGRERRKTMSELQTPQHREGHHTYPSPALSGKEEAMAEALIRQRIQDAVKALNAKDIDGVMSLYAPDLVSFDIAPHFGALRYFGADNKRRAWEEAFATFTGRFAYEVHELSVTAHGELAFVHSLNHVNATLPSGQITDFWLRWTACFRRIDGLWLVVHDHVSVPADLEHGRAVVNLTP